MLLPLGRDPTSTGSPPADLPDVGRSFILAHHQGFVASDLPPIVRPGNLAPALGGQS
jgi:hypothetical protein